MRIYFVRHGETEYSRTRTHQPPDMGLTERGKNQARAAAKVLMDLPQPLLITSDYERARETADIIGKMIGSIPQEEPLFREMRRPQLLFGMAYYGFHSITVGIQLILHAPYATWHYADEENFHEVRVRAHDAIKYLESLAERYEHVIVVSHAVFLSLLFSQFKRGKISIFSYLRAILKFVQLANGSISYVTCECSLGKCEWKSDLINDRRHLKEVKSESISEEGNV